MGLLGFNFSFGSKDDGLDDSFDKTLKALDDINSSIEKQSKIAKKSDAPRAFRDAAKAAADAASGVAKMGRDVGDIMKSTRDSISKGFEGLKSVSEKTLNAVRLGVGGVSGALSGIGGDTKTLTGELEKFSLETAKSVSPLLTQAGLIGPEFAKAKAQISSTAYALNMDANTVGQAFVAMRNTTEGAQQALKDMGMDLKTLSKLEGSLGISSKDLTDTLSGLTASWGFSSKQAQGTIDTMTQLAAKSGLGGAAFGKFGEVFNQINTDLAQSTVPHTADEIAAMASETVRLAGVFKAMGGSADESMSGAMSLAQKLRQEQVELEKMQAGLGGQFGESYKAIEEIFAVTGKGGSSSEWAKAMIKLDPMSFAKEMLGIQGELQGKLAGMTEGTKEYNAAQESLSVFTQRFNSLMGAQSEQMVYALGNYKKAPAALAKMQKASEGAAGATARLAKQGYVSGITLDIVLERQEAAFDQTLKNVAKPAFKQYVKAHGEALKELSGVIKDASKDPVWGGLVKKMVAVRDIGFRALIPLTPFGQGLEMVGEMAIKGAKEIQPLLGVLGSLKPVFGIVTGAIDLLGNALGAVVAMPIAATGLALQGFGAALHVVGKVATLVGDGLVTAGDAMISVGQTILAVAPDVDRFAEKLGGVVESAIRMGEQIPLVGPVLTFLGKAAGMATEYGVKFAGGAVKAVGYAVTGMGMVTKGAGKALGAVGGALDMAGDASSAMGEKVMSAAKSVQGMGPGILKTIGVMSTFALTADKMGPSLMEGWKKIEPLVQAALIKITDWFRSIDWAGLGRRVVIFFAELPQKIADGFAESSKPASDRMKNSFGSVLIDAISAIAGGIGSFLSSMWGEFTKRIQGDEGKKGIGLIGGALKWLFEQALNVAFDISNTLAPALKKAFDSVMSPDFGKDMVKKFQGMGSEAVGAAGEGMEQDADKVSMGDKLMKIFETMGMGMATALIGGFKIFLAFIDANTGGMGTKVVEGFMDGLKTVLTTVKEIGMWISDPVGMMKGNTAMLLNAVPKQIKAVEDLQKQSLFVTQAANASANVADIEASGRAYAALEAIKQLGSVREGKAKAPVAGEAIKSVLTTDETAFEKAKTYMLQMGFGEGVNVLRGMEGQNAGAITNQLVSAFGKDQKKMDLFLSAIQAAGQETITTTASRAGFGDAGKARALGGYAMGPEQAQLLAETEKGILEQRARIQAGDRDIGKGLMGQLDWLIGSQKTTEEKMLADIEAAKAAGQTVKAEQIQAQLDSFRANLDYMKTQREALVAAEEAANQEKLRVAQAASEQSMSWYEQASSYEGEAVRQAQEGILQMQAFADDAVYGSGQRLHDFQTQWAWQQQTALSTMAPVKDQMMAFGADTIEAVDAVAVEASGSGQRLGESVGTGLKNGLDAIKPAVDASVAKLAEPVMSHSDPLSGPFVGIEMSGFTLATMWGTGFVKGLAVADGMIQVKMAIMASKSVATFMKVSKDTLDASVTELGSGFGQKVSEQLASAGIAAPDVEATTNMVVQAAGIPALAAVIATTNGRIEGVLIEIRDLAMRTANATEETSAKLSGKIATYTVSAPA